MERQRRRFGARSEMHTPEGRRPSRPAGRVWVRLRPALLAASGLLAAGSVIAGGRIDAGARPAAAASGHTLTPAARPPLAHAASASHLVVTAPVTTGPSWTTVAHVAGHPAAWIAQRSGVTLMALDQRYVHLALHTGVIDGGAVGWTYGDQITPREIHLVVAAFNGGFKLSYANVGFVSGGRVAVALKPGLASIVTYTDGTTNIAAWHNGVPSARRSVFSVLQNQFLLVDRGAAAANVTSCVIACWGVTIQNLIVVPRSGLGITASGRLVWAAGEQLTPATLAGALISAGAVRAIELDINPYAVAGYLYVHHATGPVAVPVIPGQQGIPGQLLTADNRDFFAVIAN